MEQQALLSPDGASGHSRVISKKVVFISLGVIALLVAIAVFNFFYFRGPEHSAGRIVGVGTNFVILQNQPGFQIKVLFDNETVVRLGRTTVEPESLKIGGFVLVFGAGRNGTIEAEEIVILEDRPPIPR